MDDPELRAALGQLPYGARDELRRLLIREQPERDAIAEQLLRRGASGADDLADLIDMLTIDDEARRRVVRTLGELETERPSG